MKRLLTVLDAGEAATNACMRLIEEAAITFRAGSIERCGDKAGGGEAEQDTHGEGSLFGPLARPRNADNVRRQHGKIKTQDQGAWPGRIAATAAAILSGAVTGSEQVSPTQTKAALPDTAFSFSCAGCVGDNASADGARSTMRSR